MKRWVFGTMVAAAISTFLFTGCKRSPLESSAFKVEVIDGIRHIHNLRPQRGNTPGARLELVGKIGELDTEDEKKILYDPVDAARLPNGDILVLEAKGRRVKRFNRDHQLMSAFGRLGQGPGDLNVPYLLRLNGNRDRLFIADSKIQRYFIDGRYEESFRPERGSITNGSLDSLFHQAGMAVLSGNRVVLPNGSWKGTDPAGQPLLSLYDEKGTVVLPLGTVKPYADPKLTLNANVAYFAADLDDHLYVAFEFLNRIEEYSPDGRMIFSSDWVLPFEVKTELKELLFKSGSVERKFPWPSVTSVSMGVFLDRKNRIWVLTYIKQPNEFGEFGKKENRTDCLEFNVFDAGGIQLFKVPVPDVRFNAFSLYDDRVFLIDATSESCVYEFKIVEAR